MVQVLCCCCWKGNLKSTNQEIKAVGPVAVNAEKQASRSKNTGRGQEDMENRDKPTFLTEDGT